MAHPALAIDSIITYSQHQLRQWTPQFKRTQAHALLTWVILSMAARAPREGPPNLFTSRTRASHARIAAALGLSREWVCTLSGRLVAAGWLVYRTRRIGDGTFEVGTYSPGRLLKRVLCTLLYARWPRPRRRVNSAQQKVPDLPSVCENTRETPENFHTQQDKPPAPPYDNRLGWSMFWQTFTEQCEKRLKATLGRSG